MKKESALRKTFKKLLSKDPDVHLTWVESHSTAIGDPDLQYCCNDIEGWLELKSGPDIEVRATQARWMKDHIESGGRPLFFIEWAGVFHVVPGSRADDLRVDPSHESVRKASVVAWRSGSDDARRIKNVMECHVAVFNLTPMDDRDILELS